MNNLEGFRQMTELEIRIRGPITKERVAEMCIPKDVTFDYTLPQQWLDSFMKKGGMRYAYSFVLATTFMLYSDERGFRQGIPWSACAEVDRQIQSFSNREDGPMPEVLTVQKALEIVLKMARDMVDSEDDMVAINIVRNFYLGK